MAARRSIRRQFRGRTKGKAPAKFVLIGTTQSRGTSKDKLRDKFLKVKGIDGNNLLTSEQAEQLLSLNDIIIIENTPLFESIDKNFLSFVIGSIVQNGFANTFDYLSSIKEKVSVEQSITRKQIIMESPTLSLEKSRVIMEIQVQREKIAAVEGVYTCKKCGSNKTISYQKQERAADEPLTTVITCINCNHRWKIS